METGLRQRAAAYRPLDFAMDGSRSTRGFWTKRKKTGVALLAVLALVCGIAVAFKLFDKQIANNVVKDASNFNFDVLAQDVSANANSFTTVPTTEGGQAIGVYRKYQVGTTNEVNTYPGDKRLAIVQIKNTNANPQRDASFEVYFSNVRVFKPDGTEVLLSGTGSDPANFNTFTSWWKLSVAKQTYFGGSACAGNGTCTAGANCNPNGTCTENPACANHGDCAENDPNNDLSYAAVSAPCDGTTPITSINASNTCKLGIVRKAGAVTGPVRTNFDDDRNYRFNLAEDDPGINQTPYAGWSITFTLVFRAKLNPDPEPDRWTPVLVPTSQ